nr:MAG TPA: hypothetical protein [Bacteriophage sp.]
MQILRVRIRTESPRSKILQTKMREQIRTV